MDLYNIPGDTGKFWRLDKFVEYQHEVPALNFRVMGEFIHRHNMNPDEIVMMCWFMSCTYNEITCGLLYRLFDWKSLTKSNVDEYCQKFWEVYKDLLDFGSARKYAKNMDWFPILMSEFIKVTHKHPYRWLMNLDKGDSVETYFNICKNIEKLAFVGRFARNLFVESVIYNQDLLGIRVMQNADLDWNRCANLTSGVLNIAYHDEEANQFDKLNHLPPNVTEEQLTRYLLMIQKRIHKLYPDQDDNIHMFVTKICSFRNLFKASRYGGFHHDRELGVLRAYEKTFPEQQDLWDEFFAIRKDMFPERFLGELHDWNGIRPERKKLWLRKGLTGVEPEIFDKC